jgi:nucleotide sugar dehydrogenase
MKYSDYLTELDDRIVSLRLRIAVVGLGYVGLPTAIAFHNAGFNVVGIDSSSTVIHSLKKGISPITEEIGMKIPNGTRWAVTSEFGNSIENCDLAILCVPTPVDEHLQPDVKAVRSAIDSTIKYANKDNRTIIILESTVQPGTTRSCITDSIDKFPGSKEKILMAYCPERVSPGEGGYGVEDVARVIGSEDLELTSILSKLYSKITSGDVTTVSSIEVAEATKLVENAQRDIDIAFANELAILLPRLGLDVEEVLTAASTKWNFHRHTPGIGVGGHCIPIDPHYYIEIAKRNGVTSAMSPAARALNSTMPSHSAKEVIRLCGGFAPERALVLGFSYKPNVSDSRETPALTLINELLTLGTSDILVWDPLIENPRLPEKVISISDPYGHEDVDCVIIATAHDEVKGLNWKKLRETVLKPRIFDGRRCLPPSAFLDNGWSYHAIGRPWK